MTEALPEPPTVLAEVRAPGGVCLAAARMAGGSAHAWWQRTYRRHAHEGSALHSLRPLLRIIRLPLSQTNRVLLFHARAPRVSFASKSGAYARICGIYRRARASASSCRARFNIQTDRYVYVQVSISAQVAYLSQRR